MADGVPLPDLLLYWPFLLGELQICCDGFLSTKTIADNNREHLENKQEQSKNELK